MCLLLLRAKFTLYTFQLKLELFLLLDLRNAFFNLLLHLQIKETISLHRLLQLITQCRHFLSQLCILLFDFGGAHVELSDLITQFADGFCVLSFHLRHQLQVLLKLVVLLLQLCVVLLLLGVHSLRAVSLHFAVFKLLL